MMATTMAIPSLAPRPSPRPIQAWSPPKHFVEGKENRPALKQLQQSTPPSRSRRERPCDGCRKRKSKCVLQEGRRCVLCEFHKQDCTFVENAQPRKRKVDDGWKQQPGPTTKRSPAIAQRPARVQNNPPPPPARALKQQTQTPLPGASQPSMRKPFFVDETLSLQRHRHCKYLGQTTALDASLISLGSFNENNETESKIGMLRQVAGTEFFSTHADADVQIPEDEARALSEIDELVGPHGPALVDMYFRNVHSSYPIIQKQAFLDRHRHGDRQFNPPLLAAMYLLALAWWEGDPTVSSHPKPEVAKLEYIAVTSLAIAMQRPKISAVQAGLLLLQRAKSSTWTLTVQLVALGQDIGLHLDCSDWSIPRWERLLRKRLAWALYMQDKWSAVMHGRPSHINAADWNVPLPTEDDFDENISPLSTPNDAGEDVSDHQVRGRIVFMQMISLTAIMSEVCETFYSETAKAEIAQAGAYATQLVLNRAKPVQIKLKDWFAKLPAACKMDSSSSSTSPSSPSSPSSASPSSNPSSSPQGYLHLAYFATEISIHRRIVQSLDPPTTTSTSLDPYMLYICRSAAKTRLISALDFINRLKPPHLSAFWFFPSASNFALIGTFGALLLATSPGREEAAFYRARLGEFRWTLSVSARKAAWITEAVEMLDATGEMLKRVKEKPEVVSPLPLSMAMTMGEEVESAVGNGAYQQQPIVGEEEMEIDSWTTETTNNNAF